MTLHRHKVDDRTWVEDGYRPLDVPAGWQIADGSADDVRVCAAHPWQSSCLVFANGDSYGTAACFYPSYIGNAQFALSVEKITKKLEILNPLKLKLGKKMGKGGQLCTFLVVTSTWVGHMNSKDANGVSTRQGYGHLDVLLRKRA
jgi:hypothetical protein